MARKLIEPLVFSAGLVALCAIAVGYLGSNALALAVVLVIAACYGVGGLELRRYRRATAALSEALSALTGPVPRLADWLDRLPADLRPAVRQRIEGGRGALPAPALTPYLVGLLVLLGMLGTLLGMMATLRGTGLALESASDLDAVRSALASPVKGLAFAFGTSIAGVAASAMLGLLSALCRRERAAAVDALDAAITTTLREHSHAQQREEAFRLLQRQAEGMPLLVDRLQAMMAAIEQQSLTAHERQAAQQVAFFEHTGAVHARLAESVEASLKSSVAEGTRAASAALQPVVETTLAALTRNAAAVHEDLTALMRRQLEETSGHLHESTDRIARAWTDAATRQQRADEARLQGLQQSLEMFTATFEQRASQLVDTVGVRFETASDRAAAAWNEATARQAAVGESMTQALESFTTAFDHRATQLVDTVGARFEAAGDAAAAAWHEAAARQVAVGETTAQALESFTRTFEQRASQLVDTVGARFEAAGDRAAAVWAEAASRQAALGESAAQAMEAFTTAFEQRSARLVDTVGTRFEAASDAAASAWTEALSRQAALGEATTAAHERALTAALATFESHAASLVDRVQQSHVDLQVRLDTQAQAHARDTLAEIARLVHDAAEAPRAAAAVIAELRQSLSESLVRDTATLEERGRLLATVETLLGAVNHASAEQRAAVDALISTAADALERVSARFTDRVDAEAGRLDAAADRIAAGAIEVASLGDVFGAAVQRFGEANEQLVARLQAVEGALEQSLARSDEQLGYYVAQARDVVDLSVMAQKQIIGELQQLARQRAAVEPA